MHDYRGTAFASELLISVNKVNIFWGSQKISRNHPVDFVFFKVHVIWEGHKNMTFTLLSNFKWNLEISSNFSDLLRIFNFRKMRIKEGFGPIVHVRV